MSARLPELRGEKVVLRPFAPEDITTDYVGWLNDRHVTRFSNQRFREHSFDSCRAYLASFEGTPNLFVSVRLASNGQAIGTMSAYRNLHHNTCDVGIMIGAREYWSGGYGQESWNLLLDWLLAREPDGGGVRKVTAGTLACNGGMVKLMERSGMTRTPSRGAQEIVEGEPQDIVLYGRFA